MLHAEGAFLRSGKVRDLLATDAAVATRLPLADLDACFDDAAVLRHVPAVIERLDALETTIRGRTDELPAPRSTEAAGAAR